MELGGENGADDRNRCYCFGMLKIGGDIANECMLDMVWLSRVRYFPTLFFTHISEMRVI